MGVGTGQRNWAGSDPRDRAEGMTGFWIRSFSLPQKGSWGLAPAENPPKLSALEMLENSLYSPTWEGSRLESCAGRRGKGRVPPGKGPTRGSMGKWEVTESWLTSERWDHLSPLAARCQCNCEFLPGSQFWVTVQRTEAAERCGLHGSFVLRVEAEKLTLLTVGTQSQILEPVLSWPYTLLRRYGRDKVGVRAVWVWG